MLYLEGTEKATRKDNLDTQEFDASASSLRGCGCLWGIFLFPKVGRLGTLIPGVVDNREATATFPKRNSVSDP